VHDHGVIYHTLTVRRSQSQNTVPGALVLHTNQGMVTTKCDSEQSGCHKEYASYPYFKVKYTQCLKRSVLPSARSVVVCINLT